MTQIRAGRSAAPSVRLRALSVILACVIVGACGGGSSDSSEPAELPSADELRSVPYSEGVEVGATYSYVVDTHCGVEWALIDGDWWTTELLDDGNANPPPGWGNPAEGGQLTIVDADAATFEADSGPTVVFTRTTAANRDPCE